MDFITNQIAQNNVGAELSIIFGNFASRDYDDYVNLVGETFGVLRGNDASTEMVDRVLEQADQEGDCDSTFLNTVRNFAASPEDLKFIAQRSSCLSDIRYLLTQVLDTSSFGQIFNVLIRTHEDILDREDLVHLKHYISQHEKRTGKKASVAMDFIEMKMKEYAEKPSWVSIHQGESIGLLKTTPAGLQNEDKNKLIEKMIEESNQLNKSDEIEQAISIFQSTLSDNIASSDDTFIRSYRVWGPENSFKDRDCPCNPDMKGPCRMFVCMCREDEDSNEWFTGRCDVTNKRIKNISHAIRYPVKGGGWKGCFSSFKAMLEDPPYQMNGEDHVRVKQLRLNLSSYGVMDRSL